VKFAHFSHVWNKPNMTPAQRYEQLWRELAACDELDFDSGFAVEHHFNPKLDAFAIDLLHRRGSALRTRFAGSLKRPIALGHRFVRE
jgi:hypothetical protein